MSRRPASRVDRGHRWTFLTSSVAPRSSSASPTGSHPCRPIPTGSWTFSPGHHPFMGLSELDVQRGGPEDPHRPARPTSPPSRREVP